MGYRLFREVRDRAPGDIPSGERLVWLMLADYADDTTREAYPGMVALSRSCGLTPAGVSKALQRLAARGFDLRVPLGKDRHGRAVYAREGMRSHYRMPEWPVEGGPQSDHRGRTTVLQRADHSPSEGGPQSDPSPHRTLKEPSSPRTRATKLAAFIAEHDVTDDEMKILTEKVKVEHPTVRSPGAYLTAMVGSGDLADLLTDMRGERQRGELADERKRWHAHLDQQSECEHGYAGGHLADAQGWVRCPLERRRRDATVRKPPRKHQAYRDPADPDTAYTEGL